MRSRAQVDHEADITAVATDVLTGEQFRHALHFSARRPRAFSMHKLRACRRYHVTFDGIAESDERGDSSATFHTPDPSCPDFVAIGVSANCPSRLQPSDTNLWSHLAKSLDVRRPCLPSLVPALSGPTMHLQVPWHGVDVMLHLGGQIPLATAMQEAIHFLREATAKGADAAVIDAAIRERFREHISQLARSATCCCV